MNSTVSPNQTATVNHELDDIRAVVMVEKTAEVNHHGERIGPLVVVSESLTAAGWKCIPCDVTFRQWAAVLAHMRDPRRIDLSKPTVEALMVFARDILGVTISPAQAAVAKGLIGSTQALRLERSGRNAGKTATHRVAFEWRKKHGMAGRHADLMIFDDHTRSEGGDVAA